MSGVVVNGLKVDIEGLKCFNWDDEPGLKLTEGEDCRPRKTSWIRGITLHTTLGVPKELGERELVKPGVGDPTNSGRRIGKWWARDGKQAGAHAMVDHDASIGCMADLAETTTFHAGSVNDVTIGVEIYQDYDEQALYEEQLDAVVLFCDWMTKHFGIQRQLNWPYAGEPTERMRKGGKDVIGIYGHRDVTSNRFYGDPGNQVFEKLIEAGYEPFNYGVDQDLDTWKQRQEQLNAEHNAGLGVDGVAGPGTVKALLNAGYKHGLWVSRPQD